MNRRTILTLAAAGAVTAREVAAQEQAARATRALPSPKIKDVQVIATSPAGLRLAVVKIVTDQDGLYGYGCATYTQRADLVVMAVEKYVKPFLLGKPADRIDDTWQALYNSSYWRNGPVLNNAISGVDQAAWPTRVELEGNLLTCRRQNSDSGKLNVAWPVPGFGRPIVTTASLPERDEPYLLAVELARGKIVQIRNQLAFWHAAGMSIPPEFTSSMLSPAPGFHDHASIDRTHLALSAPRRPSRRRQARAREHADRDACRPGARLPDGRVRREARRRRSAAGERGRRQGSASGEGVAKG
jgi:hypothetical protein